MVLRANARGAVHDKAAGHIFQFFGHILTQAAKLATTMGAFCTAGGQLDLHTGDMVRDRFALRLVGGGIVRQAQLGRQRGDGDLTRLQGQLQLLCGLRRSHEPMGTMARQLVPQLLDQNRLRPHFGQQKCCECPQFQGAFRQRFGDIQHGKTIAKQAFYGNPKTAKALNLSCRQRPPGAQWQAPVNPFQQHRQLRRRQRNLAFLRRGPDEPPLLQPFGEQTG